MAKKKKPGKTRKEIEAEGGEVRHEDGEARVYFDVRKAAVRVLSQAGYDADRLTDDDGNAWIAPLTLDELTEKLGPAFVWPAVREEGVDRIREHLCNFVVESRQRLGLTQRDLAALMRKSAPWVASIEQRRQFPPWDLLLSLCLATRTDSSVLLEPFLGSGAPPAQASAQIRGAIDALRAVLPQVEALEDQEGSA